MPMSIKLDIEVIFIYCAMLLYLGAAAAFLFRLKKAGVAAYLLGFACAVTGFATRWCYAQHVPLQNLFEVFLTLGMLICPVSFFCLRFLRVGALWADCLIGAVVLFAAGFVFRTDPQRLPPALQSGFFIPHVAAYMGAYMIMAKGGMQALGQLICRDGGGETRLVSYELGTYRVVALGFPLLTLGLVLGAMWGKIAWGDYWNWDPKELWSLAAWLIYAGYLHFRYASAARYPRVNSAMALLGLLAIIITLLWVNLARIFAGLHTYAV
jgi:ABC-type transport system involved in cytochrome c biogenesis permease subunit